MRSSSRSSPTASTCWRRSRCAPLLAGPSWRGWGSALSGRREPWPWDSRADWLDRFGALLGNRGRLAERRLVLAVPSAPPGDPERRLELALDLGNAIWRLRGATPGWTRCLLLALRYTATSDERREGLVWLGFNAGTGAVLGNDLVERLRQAQAGDLEWRVPDPAVRAEAGQTLDAPMLAERVREQSTTWCGAIWSRSCAPCAVGSTVTAPGCTRTTTICAAVP